MAKKAEPGKVKRSIYFYDLYTYTVESSEKKPDDQKKVVEKDSHRLSAFFSGLQERQHNKSRQLNNVAGQNRDQTSSNLFDYSDFFVDLPSGNRLLIKVYEQFEDRVFLEMILSRVNALPQIERQGNLESLGDLINQDQNIAEVTHCIYYQHYGVMGAEFNFSGAYPSKIADYINVVNEKYGSNYITECSSKLDNDVFSKLDAGKDFSLFDLSLRKDERTQAYIRKEQGALGHFFSSISDVDTMQVVMKKRKTKKNDFRGFNPPMDIAAMQGFVRGYRESIARFNVSQGSISDSINLLSDKFSKRVMLDVDEERTIDSNEMFAYIDQTFNSDVKEFCSKYDEPQYEIKSKIDG